MHRKVNIQQYVKTPSGKWQWESIPKNPRTGHYLWAKTKSPHFYLVWREHGKKRYEKAGISPSEILEAKRRKEFELAGRAILERGRKLEKPEEHGLTLEPAIASFLDFIKNKKRPNTHKRYRIVMDHVQQFFRPGTPLASITPADIDTFRDERLQQKNPWEGSITPRNVNYEVSVIRTFFYYLQRFHDADLKNPAANMRTLAVTKTIVDSYDEAELEAFFKACTPEERAIFKMFYYTGLRDQELAHLHWSDLNLAKGFLRVRAKPEHSFVPKDWEEREIPLHADLVALLKELPKRNELVFPSFRGNPNRHLLRLLMTIVDNAKLPGRWYVHKFRKTFATRALEKGADIRTVQALLGHKNITTTARYLSTSTDKMREAVGSFEGVFNYQAANHLLTQMKKQITLDLLRD